jgi:hypothetical protein
MIGKHKILVYYLSIFPVVFLKSFSKTSKIARTQVRDRYTQNTSGSTCGNSIWIPVCADTQICIEIPCTT